LRASAGNGKRIDALRTLSRSVIMPGRSAFFALALATGLTASVASFAQDAGVSGIPHGPGSAGGLNNSVNDPSGIGNAARIPPPPQPSISVPPIPSASPMVSTRVAPALTPRVKRINPRAEMPSRREIRRASARARDQPLDGKFSICRGC
jgi:hypothetical protein